MGQNNDLARMQQFFSDIVNSSSENATNAQSNANEMRAKGLEMMERLLNREDEAATGNPFIDMLNGYVKMKKRSNPNYQWEGFAPKIARGVGGLLGMNTGGRLGLTDGSVRPSFLTAQPQISESSPGALDQYRQTQSMRPTIYEEN